MTPAMRSGWRKPVCSAIAPPCENPASTNRSAFVPRSLSLPMRVSRSEEHTSELQSPCNLVCRLLLEKKKKRHRHHSRCRHYHYYIRTTQSRNTTNLPDIPRTSDDDSRIPYMPSASLPIYDHSSTRLI